MQGKVLLKKTSKITPFYGQSVDIIIPYFEKYNNVSRLIESIFRNTYTNRFRITLVDDSSPNVAFGEFLRKVPGLGIYRTPYRSGFGAALELGFNNTKQPWVVFMHSDVLPINHNWLLGLGNTMLNCKSQGVKLVTSRTNRVMSGDTRVVGSLKKDLVINEGFLSLHCAMVHRDLFSKIGGFVKKYPIFGYEDQELGERMNHYGYKQAISAQSFVEHKCGLMTTEAKSTMEENKLKYEMDIKLLKEKSLVNDK